MEKVGSSPDGFWFLRVKLAGSSPQAREHPQAMHLPTLMQTAGSSGAADITEFADADQL
jgi:hypothetical protein